jgi:hypothetical protein
VFLFVFLPFQQQQQAGASGDQELGPDGKTIPKSNFSMDTALEDKICDLYDLFVDVHKTFALITSSEDPVWFENSCSD